MENVNKQKNSFFKLLILLGLTLFLPTTAEGNCCEEPCNNPCQENCLLKAHADLLLWTVFPERNYALDSTDIATGNEGGDEIFISPRLDPGFRIGLEYPLIGCCSGGWNLAGNYTWFYSGLHDSKSSSAIKPVKSVAGANNTEFTSAQADLSHHINLLEVSARKDFYLNRCVVFRPFTGISAIYVVRKENNAFLDTAGRFDKLQFDHSTYGVGPLGGIELDWHFLHCLKLTGKTTAATFVGRYKLRNGESFYDTSTTTRYDEKGSFAVIGLILSQTTGIHTNMCVHGFPVELGVDWDASAIIARFIRARVTGISISGSLSF